MNHSQFVVSIRASNSGGAGPSGVRRGEEEMSDAVVMKEVDQEHWDLGGVMTATEANESIL